MTIAHRGLNVKVMGQVNAVGPTSIGGSFSSLFFSKGLYNVILSVCITEPCTVFLRICNLFVTKYFYINTFIRK